MIKWHDLKKNPMDLPKDGDGHLLRSADVVVYLEHGEGNEYWYTLGYYSYEHKEWWYSMGKERFAEPITVAKWAYIEYTEDAKPSPQHDLTELRDAILEAANEIHGVTKDNLNRVKEIDGTLTVGATVAIYTAAYTNILLAIVKGFADYGK